MKCKYVLVCAVAKGEAESKIMNQLGVHMIRYVEVLKKNDCVGS